MPQQMNPKAAKINVPPGRLGLGVRFLPSGGAVVTQVLPECPFRGRVDVGDVIVAIDGKKPSTPEDMARGNDRAREFEIAKSAAAEAKPERLDAASKKRCCHDECTNLAVKMGVCWRHGAKHMVLSARRERESAGIRFEGAGTSEKEEPTAMRNIDGSGASEEEEPIATDAGATSSGRDPEGSTSSSKSLPPLGEASEAHPPEIMRCNLFGCGQPAVRDGLCWRHATCAPGDWSTEYTWDRCFVELVIYKTRNGGSCGVPGRFNVDAVTRFGDAGKLPLGRFVKEMRRYRRVMDNVASGKTEQNGAEAKTGRYRSVPVMLERAESILTPERIEALDGIGFSWVAHKGKSVTKLIQHMEIQWEDAYKELEKFRDENGHCNPPSKSSLGRWCTSQRVDHNKLLKMGNATGKGDKEWRTKEFWEAFAKRKAKLDTLGFEWNRAVSTPIPWEQSFESLKEYKSKYGDCRVPQCPPHKRLAFWVNRMRKDYKDRADGKKSSMTNERIEQLESIGFEWNLKNKTHIHGATWERSYNELVQFCHKNGHCNPPNKSKLGRWCTKQRHHNRVLEASEGGMGPNGGQSEDGHGRVYAKVHNAEFVKEFPKRKAKLDAIGFMWNKRQAPRPAKGHLDDSGDESEPGMAYW